MPAKGTEDQMNRRNFLKTASAATAFAMSLSMSKNILAAGAVQDLEPVRLSVAKRNLEINGKAAEVLGLVQSDGSHGLALDTDVFDVELVNAIGEPTLIHWHGLTPPWAQDGVPDNPAALLNPSESRRYLFAAGKGTHWMHAHALQEQRLLAAPLIVRSAEDLAADEQEVVVLLHDFSFKSPEELLAGLRKGAGSMQDMHMNGDMTGEMQGDQSMSNMQMSDMDMNMDAMDVNDIEYDAYIANDRTLDDPQIFQVDRNGVVRLRIINGATATAFSIDLGALSGSVAAVDGKPVKPVDGSLFPIAMGQRLDIRLRIPKEGGAFPVLALREDAPQRAGVVLATAGAKVEKLAVNGQSKGPLLDLNFESGLVAVTPLQARAVTRRYQLALTGNMKTYDWKIGGGEDLAVAGGDRVEITMSNSTMMAHPMHLHGHHFQVTAINGTPIAGALRDTVLVPPMQEVTIAFDAGNPGRWPFHCHHLYHMATGMMAFVHYGMPG